ncbi:MAG: GAF domain-containing protein [Chloroflexi bacterium]|nr:MAG: GAF domain-containing protein [Chloroflexota bacterium]
MSQQLQSQQEQLHRLSQQTKELVEQLRAQREALRQYGMNLPPGSLDSARALRAGVQELANQVTAKHVELRQLRGLAGTTAVINSQLDTSSVLNHVLDTAIQLTGAERGYIVLRNEENELEFRVARGMDQEDLQRADSIVSMTIVQKVADTGEPVLTDNAAEDPNWQNQASIFNYALRSIIAVPLKVRNTITGVVYCDNRALSGLFKPHDLNLLTAFAHQAAVAIENARLFEDVRLHLAKVTEMRDLMDNVFTSIASGVITVNNHGIVRQCNLAAANILGYEQETIIDAELFSVLPEMDNGFVEKLRNVRDQQTSEVYEAEPVLNGRGKRNWYFAMSPLRDANGTGHGIAIVLDDLTEVKQREAQLAEVRRYLPEALVRSLHSIDQLDMRSQEREITALFADINDFTTFSEHLEPEVLMTIINEYLSLASEAINLQEGVVDKYAGDAVTGLFNTQLNPQEEDHALRAVRTAKAIIFDVEAMQEENERRARQAGEEVPQKLFFGIGIHTGPAVLGNVGSSDRREFNAIGEAMDLCKYAQEYAGPGEVIITGATYAYIKNYFECERVESQPGDEHIAFYRVGNYIRR